MTAYVSTGSGLNSDFLASAFVESVRLLNDAERARNAANASQAPKNNVVMSAEFEGNSFSINVTLPIAESLAANGTVTITPSNYLGGAYSVFTVGTGEAKSTTLQGLVLELAQKLSAAEKSVQPESDQPTNISVDISLETRLATISAAIPFNPTLGANGEVTLIALNYV